MESSLTRTLKTKDRLCCEAIKEDDIDLLKMTKANGTVKWIGYLTLAVEVAVEAQEAIQGTRPEMMHPGWCRSKVPSSLQYRDMFLTHCTDTQGREIPASERAPLPRRLT